MLGHTLLVSAHVAAVSVGFGAAMIADWIVLTRMTFVDVAQRPVAQVTELSRAVAAGLCLAWVTGLALVADNWAANPATILNEKLWAKVVIVAILTLNGVLLHHFALPLMRRRVGGPMFGKRGTVALLSCTLLAAVSLTGWTSGLLLGLARELNGVVKMTNVLVAAAVTWQAAWFFGALLAFVAQWRLLGKAAAAGDAGLRAPRALIGSPAVQ